MILNSAFERGDYDWLYANYLDESHGLLGEAVQAIRNEIEVAVDLCAGTGAMTFQLVGLQVPRVYAVDSSRSLLAALRRKIKPLDILYSNVTTVKTDLNHPEAMDFLKSALPRATGHKADLITCRQAVGYLSHRTLARVPELLAPGGRFLFNTFIEPPKGQVWFHRRSGGIAEAGFYAFGRVFHLQARWPRVDATVFTWHNVEGVLKPLWEKSGYRVNVSQHGRTLIVEVSRPHAN